MSWTPSSDLRICATTADGDAQSIVNPTRRESRLTKRPYDLRHAAASLWLSAGVPATEVARRLGQGVAVLLRVYANCIDGTDHDNNQRIGTALG